MRLHRLNWVVLTAALLLAAGVVPAETIDMVPVGSAGNANDSTGYGGVGYTYNIGKYEVTNAQYSEFLNNVDPNGTNPYSLYSNSMGSGYGGITFTSGNPSGSKYAVIAGRGNMPVNYVSFWDSCRFANWLNNGQGSLASTETGAYTLTATGTADNTVTRNADWKWAVASENEWYKASYHKNDGVTGNYFAYPTASDTAPTAQGPPGTDVVNGSDNYYNVVGDLTNVGAYTYKPSTSPYGTFDQGGNVWEWNEAILYYSSSRGFRGGSFSELSTVSYDLLASTRSGGAPTFEGSSFGFRVASVPESGSIILLVSGAIAGLMCWRRWR